MQRILSLIFLCLITCYAEQVKVIGISDGDTITVLAAGNVSEKVRLEGIDAPEKSQEFGNKSKLALGALLYGKSIVLERTGKDKYGRTIGWLKADGASVNHAMIRSGFAWHFKKYNHDASIAELENQAKFKKCGLWSAPNLPMAPWEYRQLKKTQAVASPMKPALDASYWINLSNQTRHNQSCRWFRNTKEGRIGLRDEGKACSQCGG